VSPSDSTRDRAVNGTVTYFLDNEGNRIAAMVPVLVAKFAIEHGALRVSEA
jgi:hypothetical protein